MTLSERRIATVLDDTAAGRRLDAWLSERFTYLSRRQWQDAIRAGQIKLNGKPVKASRLLQSGETVTFDANREEPAVTMQYEIIFEDEYLLGIDKGGNLPCHPAGPFFRNTLWYDLCQRYGKVMIVNRLDRETSGVMLVAKNAEACARLTELFSSESLHKQYYAMVHGNFSAPLEARGWLTGDPHSEVRKKRRFVPEKPNDPDKETAVTFFRPLHAGTQYSLIEATPSTGRLHQIRATLCSLGFPLVGDKLYGLDDHFYLRFIDGQLTAADRTRLVIARQALHACKLQFTHPFTGHPLTLVSPLPFDLMGLLTAAD